MKPNHLRQTPAENPKYLRAKELAQRLRISPSTMWHWTKRPGFPTPMRPTPRTTIFDVAAVEAFIARGAK